MTSKTTVEIADRMSRKRAVIFAAAAGAFLLIQVITRPVIGGSTRASSAQTEGWAINALVLMLCLATGGGLVNGARLRALINDEVSRSNYKTAVGVGYWVAMALAIGLYGVQGYTNYTGRQAAYVIVTLSISIAIFVFSYLELRAHRDA